VPDQRPQNVIPTRVLVPREVVEDVWGSRRIEERVAHLVGSRELHERDLLEEIRRDRLDLAAELEERPQRREVRVKRLLRQLVDLALAVAALSTPDPVFIEITAGDLVHVVDPALLAAPLDERAKLAPVGRLRPFGEILLHLL